MRVAVYGNLIADRIVISSEPITLGAAHKCTVHGAAGGIGNFVSAAYDAKLFKTIAASAVGDDELGLKLRSIMGQYGITAIKESDIKTTSATVLVDPANGQRTGFVDWGACSRYVAWPYFDADWHHFMYLDRITISPERLAAYGRSSADFCEPDEIPQYKKHLSNVDVLITSQGVKFDATEAAGWTRRGAIIHQPGKCVSIIDGVRSEYDVEMVDGLNVLGAGDYFAAHAIANLVVDAKVDLEAIHHATLNKLRRQS